MVEKRIVWENGGSDGYGRWWMGKLIYNWSQEMNMNRIMVWQHCMSKGEGKARNMPLLRDEWEVNALRQGNGLCPHLVFLWKFWTHQPRESHPFSFTSLGSIHWPKTIEKKGFTYLIFCLSVDLSVVELMEARNVRPWSW